MEGRLSRSRDIIADEFSKSGFTCFNRNYSTCQKPRGERTNRAKKKKKWQVRVFEPVFKTISTRYNTINRIAMNLHCVSKRKSEILRAIISRVSGIYIYKRWNSIWSVFGCYRIYREIYNLWEKWKIPIVYNVVARWPLTLIFSIFILSNDSSIRRQRLIPS